MIGAAGIILSGSNNIMNRKSILEKYNSFKLKKEIS